MNPLVPSSHQHRSLHFERAVREAEEQEVEEQEVEDVPEWLDQEEHNDPSFDPSILLGKELSPGAIRAAEEDGIGSDVDLAVLEYEWETSEEAAAELSRAQEVDSFSSNVLFVSGPHEFVDLDLIKKLQERLDSISDEDSSESLDLDQLSFERAGSSSHGEKRKDWRTKPKLETVKLQLKVKKPSEDALGWMTTWKNVGDGVRPPHDETEEIWRMLELSDVAGFSYPPRSLHHLFSGMSAVFSTDVGTHSTTTGDLRFFEDLFIAFGGSVMEKKSHDVTHFFGCYAENNDAKTRGDDLSPNCVSIHPHWIALSVEHGLLLPPSLFELDSQHFLTRGERWTSGQADSGLINSSVQRRYWHTSNINHDTVLINSPSPALPASDVHPVLCGRQMFFDASETKWNGVALRAIKSAVERLGATVVGGVERADWVVAEQPSGRAYNWARRRLNQLVLGTMEHLLNQIGEASPDVVDCFSNLLYFPLLSELMLDSFEVEIDSAYPFAYRRYLVTLAEKLGSSNVVECSSFQPARGNERKIVISESCKTQYGSGRVALPKFLEDCLMLDRFVGNISNLLTASPFLEVDHIAPLYGPSLPPSQRQPSSVADSVIQSWNDVEKRWEHGDENPERTWKSECCLHPYYH